MGKKKPVRAAVAAVAIAGLAGGTAYLTTAGAAESSSAPDARTAHVAQREGVRVEQGEATRAPGHTRLTLTVEDCDGCEFTLYQSKDRGDQQPTVWRSSTERVAQGSVSWDLPTERTQRMMIKVHTPWEGRTGVESIVAVAYQGKLQGDAVSDADARTMKKAAACLEGTRTATEVTLPVVVQKVQVDGVVGTAAGNLAYLAETGLYTGDYHPSPEGVLGMQDMFAC